MIQINDYLVDIIDNLFINWFKNHEEDIGLSKNGWRIGSIYNFSSITYGAPYKSIMFNSEKKGLPLIRIRDLKSCYPTVYTQEINKNETIVRAGDLLIGMDAEFRPYIWFGADALLNQRVCRIEPKSGIVPYVTLLLLRSELKNIESYKTGTTVSHIGKNDFDSMQVVIPPTEEMHKFSNDISSLSEAIVNNNLEISQLHLIRDLLLPKLLSGEINASKLDLCN